MEKLGFLRMLFALSLIFTISLNVIFSSSNQTTEWYINRISKVSGMGYDVAVSGDYAFVTSNDGLDIINIQDPYNPHKESVIETDEASFGIFLKDNLAFIAAGGSGLIIANIDDPTNPIILGQSSGHGIANRVYANDNYAFMACYEDGLKIFDISILSNPVKVSDYYDMGRVDDVVGINNTLYLANTHLGIEVLNVTLPSSPQKIRNFSSPSGATGLSISDNMLFVGCYSSDVWVLDITNPDNPTMLGVHTDSDDGEAQGVVGNSTHVFVADNYGVEFLDISNLPQISKVTEYRKSVSSAHEIDFNGNFVYIAGGGHMSLLLIYEISTEQKIQFLGIYVGIPITIVVITILLVLYKNRHKIRK